MKKTLCPYTFGRAGLWAAVLFVVTSLFPSSIERVAGGTFYHFGLFSYLHLMRGDSPLQSLDVFRVMNGADDSFISLLSLAAALIVCYAFSLLLEAALTALHNRKKCA